MIKHHFHNKLNTYFNVSDIIGAYHYENYIKKTPTVKKYDFWQIFYVNTGNMTSVCDSVETHTNANNLIIFPPNKTRTSYNTAPANFDIISFSSNSLALKFLENKTILLTKDEENIIKDIVNKIRYHFEPIKGNPSLGGFHPKENTPVYVFQHIKIALEKLLLTLYERLNAEQSQTTTQLYDRNLAIAVDIQKYIHSNLASDLSLANIASHFAISTSSLKTIFKRTTGQSVIQYIIDIKIDKAKELLCENVLSNTQIAHSLKFSSSSHFAKTFKDKTGYTPSEYKSLNGKI